MTNENENIKAACCFSGHRPNKLPWGEDEGDPRCLRLKRELDGALRAVYKKGVRRFICGMAMGSDLYFAEAVLALRAGCGDVHLEAAIPCPSQDEHWPAAWRERYARALEQCDTRTLISHRYTADCMEQRNRYMVDHAGTLIAAYAGGRGGTFNTIRYALKLGRDVIELEV